jgi:hypothetical protein
MAKKYDICCIEMSDQCADSVFTVVLITNNLILVEVFNRLNFFITIIYSHRITRKYEYLCQTEDRSSSLPPASAKLLTSKL